METYRNLLVPLDGSQLSEHTLPLALNVVQRTGAQLYLACVATGPGTADDMRAYLDTLATRLRAAGAANVATALLELTSTHPLVPPGPRRVALALHEYACAHGIDLILMTSHGRGGLSRLWLGSVADALLHEARSPLLLLRPDDARDAQAYQAGFAHILIPLDGSPLAEHVIRPALALGTPGYTRYTLLQIISPLLAEHTVPPYGTGLLYDELPSLEAEAHAYLVRIAAAIRPQAVQVRTKVMVAEPAEAILACAREQQAGLIALATHGRSVLARGVLGSVADRVARGADVPVLLYRPTGVQQWQHPVYGK